MPSIGSKQSCGLRNLVTFLCCLAFIAFAGVSAVAQDPPNLANGLPSQGSFDGSSVDSANLMNGNLTLHIPLPISVPQRGKASIQYYLVVNAKTWEAVGDPNTLTGQWMPTSACGTQPPTPTGPCGQGPVLVSTASFVMTRVYQSVFTDGQGTDYSVSDPTVFSTWDGAGHYLDGNFTMDTSGYQVLAAGGSCSNGRSCLPYSGVIIDKDGTQYVGSWLQDAACSTDPGNGLPGSITTTTCSEHFVTGYVIDANGNLASAPLGIPDIGFANTNGPTFSTHLAVSTELSGCNTSFGTPWVGYLNYPAPYGQTDQIKLCFGTYPQLATSFSPAGIHQFQDVYSGHPFPGNYRQPVYLTNVILPDNTQWSLSYDSYGEITFLGIPTGASIQYTWTEGQFPITSETDITSVSRAVQSRKVTDVNGNVFTWSYSWPAPASDKSMTHTVTDPNNNDTVHVFKPIESNQTLYPYNYKETSSVAYQGTGSSRIALEETDTNWTIKLSDFGVPTDKTIIDFANGIQRLEHTDYDSNVPTLGLPVTQKEYDWGQGGSGALLREIDTVYQWQNNSQYLSANIIGAPYSAITKDGSGNKLAETDYTYDEPNYLTSYEGTVGGLPSGTHLAAPNPVRGNPTTVSKWLNTGGTVVTHTNWYDTGEPHIKIDGLGFRTTLSYDLAYNGALVTETCNALNQCVSGTYDSNTGLLTSFRCQWHKPGKLKLAG